MATYFTCLQRGTVRSPVDATDAGELELHASLMYAPGKVMSMRYVGRVVIDINGQQPVVTGLPLSVRRAYGLSATVLADGRVLVTGGSSEPNRLVNVAYHAEIWNPATGQWTRGAKAAKLRLYHLTALLLSDATVLTMGGGAGADSPVNNLNGEIYYPPYLYKKDGSGLRAPVPRSSRPRRRASVSNLG